VFAPVEPITADRPTHGTLVAAAITPQDGLRWQEGVSWRPERCPQGRTFDPCGSEFEDPPAGEGDGGLAFYRPTAFRIEDRCSTRSGRDPDAVGRVRRQAEGATTFFVARELEAGAQTLLNPYDTPLATGQTNAYLASPDAQVITGEWDPTAGLGMLEEVARRAALGLQVFIHMPIRLAEIINGEGGLIAEGPLLRTRTGARVVADPGYTGRGPDVPGTSEVQTVTITGAPTGGTFTLTFTGEETDTIAFNAAATTVQTALNALPNLDGVTVSGGAGGPYTVTFPASMGNVDQMTGDGTGLTGGTAPAVAVATTTPGVAPSVEAGLWMYATSPVVVRLDAIHTDSFVDHRVNEITHVADRLFAAYFDPCSLFAIQITDPAPEGA
jgi:hypothetical protein